jgi:hypothetical protein
VSKVVDLKNKKVVIAPVSQQSVDLVNHPALLQADILGYVDRDPIFQGKQINSKKVMSYAALNSEQPDIVLLAVHKQHRDSIIQTIKSNTNDDVSIVVLA